MSLFAFMLAAVAPPQPPPIELQPSGKWQVEYAKSSCIVSRQFGEGQHKTLFGLKPSPYSESVTMLIARQAPKQRGVGGKAEVMLSGGLVPEYARYASVSSNEMRVTTIEVPRSTLDPLAKGESIAIQAGNGVNVVLKPTAFDKAKKAMDDCESDLLTSWGFDKTAQAAVAKRPAGQIFGLIQPDDYPTEALESGIGGTVGVRMKIEQDGKISECIVMESSGAPVLDKTTCAILKKRGRFTPAQDHEGKPLPAPYFVRITWETRSF